MNLTCLFDFDGNIWIQCWIFGMPPMKTWMNDCKYETKMWNLINSTPVASWHFVRSCANVHLWTRRNIESRVHLRKSKFNLTCTHSKKQSIISHQNMMRRCKTERSKKEIRSRSQLRSANLQVENVIKWSEQLLGLMQFAQNIQKPLRTDY